MEQSKYKIYSTSEEAWKAMYNAIETAQKSVYWELFIFIDDEVGKTFFDLLERKARAGVEVKIIVDFLGSFWLSRKRVLMLRDAGVDVIFFYQKMPWRGWWHTLWSRTHRKILIVDEEVGYIGGVNIQSYMKDWWDIHVEVRGDIVRALLRSFARSYVSCGGSKRNVRHLSRKRRVFSRELFTAKLIEDEPNQHHSRIREQYTEALRKAKERVVLFSPYYFPDKQFLRALWKARKRGIKVDLLLPLRTDTRIATYAAYAWFSFLLKIGVNIRLSDQMMHGKGMIVDDDWAMIGSSNLDQISFYDNFEANIRVKDKKFVKKLQETLDGWMLKSKLVDKQVWAKRGWRQRIQEFIFFRLYYLWSKRARPED